MSITSNELQINSLNDQNNLLIITIRDATTNEVKGELCKFNLKVGICGGEKSETRKSYKHTQNSLTTK